VMIHNSASATKAGLGKTVPSSFNVQTRFVQGMVSARRVSAIAVLASKEQIVCSLWRVEVRKPANWQ